jgi:alkaline phosphatase D|tara:strand:+ start:11364 stop:12341 length:978 start_codon:yes stop_codon:yes gene_type:complete
VKSYYPFSLLLFLITLSNSAYSETYSIAFGSCINQDLPQPIWSAIEKDNIDGFIFLGDNVYGDDTSGNLIKLRSAYSKQKLQFPSWLSNKDIFTIWDDHDYGENDGGGSYINKKESQDIFLDFWDIPQNDQRNHQEGIYYDKEIVVDGLKVHFIGLDTRYFRSEIKGKKLSYQNNIDEDAGILGMDQWNWLNKTISRDADLVIIMTSIQLLATNHRFEKWSLFPNDRKKMLDLINNLDATTIVISGDRHRAGIYKYGDIFEVTSSSINVPSSRKSSSETDLLLMGDMYTSENYGFILIDGVQKKVSIGLKDIKGNVINKKIVLIK